MRYNTMKNTVRILALAALLFVGSHSFEPAKSDAQAAMSVIDISNLRQNTLTAVRTAQQISNQVTMIQNQIKTLTTLPASTFNQVKGIYGQNMSELDNLINSMDGISFDMNNMNDQYGQLYSNGFNPDTSYGQYSDTFSKWNTQLASSAKTAMQAQSVLSRVQGLNAQAMKILDSSAGADGEVRQLQNVNQMLGIVSASLNGLTENLTTSTRITATMAAEEAARKQAAAAYGDKLMKGMGSQDLTKHAVTLPDIQ
jgi:P-type conjugative transfer protein TrbJ